MITFTNSEDPDEMQQDLNNLKQTDLENSTCDPLKCTMDSPILIVSICMGKSIVIQRVKLMPEDVRVVALFIHRVGGNRKCS